MDVMTREDITKLADQARLEGQGTRVSLFMPSHPDGWGPESQGDPLRWKNLVKSAEHALTEDGMDQAAAHQLLAPAHQALTDREFWAHPGHGLAAFLDREGMQSHRLPIAPPELAVVGSGFVLGPLLPLLQDDHFFVLALSQRELRLLSASRQNFRPIDLTRIEGLPTSFDDLFAPQEGGDDAQSRPRSVGRRGAGGNAYYGGVGIAGTEQGQELHDFFRQIAHGLEPRFARRRQVVVLAGLAENIAAYHQAQRNGSVPLETLELNPDDRSDEELHSRAWELVQRRLDHENAALIDRLEEARAPQRGRGLLDPAGIADAATQGRVEVLLLSRAGWWDGQADQTVVRLGSPDLSIELDSLAVATLQAGGVVRVVPHLPEGARAAAILRY